MNKFLTAARSVLVRASKTVAALAVAVLVGLGVVASPKLALAVDPTYTSQIGEALGAVDMTSIIADVSGFSGMGFNLILTVAGVFFAAAILIAFLRKGRG